MGIDQVRRKRISTKATRVASTAVAVPAADRVVSKSDNQPKRDDTVYRDTLDRAHDYCVKAYASNEQADKMKGRGAQFMAAAIIEAFPVWLGQGKLSSTEVPSLAAVLKSDKAKRYANAVAISHFAGDKKPTGNNVQEQATFVLTKSDRQGLVKRGVMLAAHLTTVSINITMFDADMGNWMVPLAMLTPTNVRNRTWVVPEMKAKLVPLSNDPWGVPYLDHKGSAETEKFRSSEARFNKMTEPPKPMPNANTGTTPAAAAPATDKRDTESNVPVAKVTFKDLTGPTGIDVVLALDVFEMRWREMLSDKSVTITDTTFDRDHWNKLSALTLSINTLMERVQMNAADKADKAKAA